jgi:hypothetical protein
VRRSQGCGAELPKSISPSTMMDSEAKHQITQQVMVADIMTAAGEKFLVSLSSPLELLLNFHLKSQSKEALRAGLHEHINTLRSRGFEPNRIMVDPFKSLVAVQNAFPGIEVDPSGAGYHLDKIDTKIRRIKEIMRSVIAGVPYKLAKERIKDLATYTISRMNIKSTSALNDGTCPGVHFTGQKPDYRSELNLAFGDYVEAYNPKAAERSNYVTMARTEPCIVLYPMVNRNGSWVYYNLATKVYIRGSQWRKFPINQLIISAMNEMAGESAIKLADFGAKIIQRWKCRVKRPTRHIS